MNMPQQPDWFQEWIARHPIKAPPPSAMQRYTDEVINKIRALETPAPARAFHWAPQRWGAFSIGTALACALAVLVSVGRHPARVARQVESQSMLLYQIGEPAEIEELGLEEELRLNDQIMLAKAVLETESSAQIEAAAELLEQLESEGIAPTNSDPAAEGNLQDELRHLDESELAVS